MKNKNNKQSNQKTLKRMNKETKRAIAHVETLSKLYNKLVKNHQS